MKYKHIIWDWNGTILDDAWLCVESINTILKKRQLSKITLGKYEQNFTFPIKSYYKSLGLDFKNEPFEISGSEFIKEYDKKSKKVALHDDVILTLKKIKKLNIDQSILSASNMNYLINNIKYYNIDCYFKYIYGVNNYYAENKDRAGEKLIKKINIPLSSILIIGDTEYDYQISKKLNIDCILIYRKHQSMSRLKHTGVKVLDNLFELSRIIK